MADRRAAALVVAAALLIGGCFGGGDEQPAGTPAPAGEDVTGDGVPLTIDEPLAAQTLRAKRVGGGRLRAAVTVKGQAEPGTTVRIAAGCRRTGCTATDEAEVDTHWEAAVVVMGTEAHPSRLLKVVDAADASQVAFVEVRLRAKPRPAAARRRKPPSPAVQQPTAPTTPAPAPAAPAPGASGPRALVMIGDSLAEGTQAILPTLLPGWSVTTDAERGRPLAAGMQILAQTQISRPTVLAFSLFTNDDPRNVSQLESAVRTSLARAGARGCAVWATIVRPPVGGVSYAAANRRLSRLAADPSLSRRLRVVPWASAVGSHPSWVGSDGVHATPEGYRARAQMYADAARSCGA